MKRSGILQWIIAALTLPLVLSNTACQRVSDNVPASANAKEVVDNNKPAYGDTLVEGTIGEPSVLIPMLAGDSASHAVAGLIFNGLVKYDKDLTITGDLAESWDISKDGLVITFHLRKGVKWTDGVEFTAEDVMFGYRTIISDKTPTAYSEDFKQVKKAEVLDKYTFRVTYESPFAPALSSWGSLPVLPRHLLEGKDITKSELGRKPVGMGPFKLTKWTPGSEVVLESNHDYFEGRPYIDKYVYRVIPAPATMFLYERPFAPALSSWGSLPVLPRHLLEGKDITKSELGRKPVGMGPFKLTKWTPGSEVVLESNHDYFEGRPYIDKYVYRVIPDPATMFLELQAGGVDWMGLTPLQYTRQTQTPYFEKNFNTNTIF